MSKTPLEYAQELEIIMSEIENEWEECRRQLSKCDLAQEDILHFIEFSNFNACQGYTFSNKLKEIRTQRRIIKDRMDQLFLLNNYNNEKAKGKIKNAISNIKNTQVKIENKKYFARVLDEITLQEKRVI